MASSLDQNARIAREKNRSDQNCFSALPPPCTRWVWTGWPSRVKRRSCAEGAAGHAAVCNATLLVMVERSVADEILKKNRGK